MGGAVIGPVEGGGVSRAPLPCLARLPESIGGAWACLDPDRLVGIADLVSLLDLRTGPPPCSPLVAWLAAGWSLGYRILAVSSTYAMLNSAVSLGAELGSPAKTIICLPYAVILWPDLGEGEGPMF